MIALNEQKSIRIQVLRGLAITAVVFIHTTPNGLAQVFCRPFLNISVGTFLFLSGMLSDADKWHPVKRLKKILIPYAVWTLVYTVILSYKTPELLIREYFRHLVFGDSAVIMYYVFVYCELTLLIPLIDKLARSRFKYLGFIISPLEIVCVRMIPTLLGIQLNRYVGIIAGLSCLGWFTYFYLGYLIGNGLLEIKGKTGTFAVLWAVSAVLQMLEGYWYYSVGVANCGTQYKITVLLTGSLFCIMAYRYIGSDSNRKLPLLVTLGNCSFGIFFSHLVFRKLLSLIPGYTDHVFYPLNSVILLFLSLGFVMAGHRILGRFAKYIAF